MADTGLELEPHGRALNGSGAWTPAASVVPAPGLGGGGPEQPLGYVLSVNGAQAKVGIQAPVSDENVRATVGKFLSVHSGSAYLVGMITDVRADASPATREFGCRAVASLDMMGEIKLNHAGVPAFQRGVTDYPAIGDPATLLTNEELRLVYDVSSDDTINIGQLQQDSTIGAYVNVDDMLSKHFAVLGTTGVGKSSGVAVILQQILEARPNLRLFLLDGHNEYGKCFGERAQVLNPRNLRLPFWLFNFEEFVDVIFGARPGVEEEVAILADAIPRAKAAYNQYRSAADRLMLKRSETRVGGGFSADTPVPYRLADLIASLDEQMGKLENRAMRGVYHRLIQRIETVRNDPRYTFMFDNANVGGDTMADVLKQLFRLTPEGRPMTVMQLGGFPAEVVDSVVSVLCRMAFDFGLWSDGAVPLLFVCEEAHRYASADRNIGFGPTRRALSRIAKEGRKYGIFLGLVTQRPAELDATIISQCSTLFAMRMANDRDQALLRSAVSDAAANVLAFVPALGTREVLAFGEGVALPTRLKFRELPKHMLPKSEATISSRSAGDGAGDGFIQTVIERWRGATMSHHQKIDDPKPDDGSACIDAIAQDEFAAVPAAANITPDRFRILKKPLDAGVEPGVFGGDPRKPIFR